MPDKVTSSSEEQTSGEEKTGNFEETFELIHRFAMNFFSTLFIAGICVVILFS